MDQQHEMDSLHEKTFQLCKKLAHIRKIPMPERLFEDVAQEELTAEGEVYINRCALQFRQMMEFNRFITALEASYLQLLRAPEQAEEIGREGLRKLHAFLEEYTGLLSQECGWCE